MVLPWQRVSGISGLPSNYATGVAYSGMNIMLLWCSASKQGFSDSRWMTYKQAQVAGGQVRKGEHGTTAIFYTTLEKENDAGEVEHIPMLKTFTVFNVQQIDGLSLTTETVSPEATLTRCRRLRTCCGRVAQTSSRKDKTPFSAHQQMKSGYRSAICFRMRLISTLQVCMSWFTGVVAKNV